ncbi:MAG: hypothetical protein JST75_04055 [Bacteroidetes bacterium]|nr:hypothetical protein [Bacteroidota bacterium]
METNSNNMGEKNHILNYAPIVIALIPIFVGLYEYKVNNEREFGKNFLTQQSVVYDELLGDLGSISTSISNPSDSVSQANYTQAKFNFNQLYYGKLNLYQSATIEKLTDSLYNLINSYDSIKSAHMQREQLEELVDKVQDKVYKLSVECKKALRNTYNITGDDSVTPRK